MRKALEAIGGFKNPEIQRTTTSLPSTYYCTWKDASELITMSLPNTLDHDFNVLAEMSDESLCTNPLADIS
jgi:hypothetical protein